MIGAYIDRDLLDPETEPPNVRKARALLEDAPRAVAEAILIACYGQPPEVDNNGALWVWPRMAQFDFCADQRMHGAFIAYTPPLRYSRLMSFETGSYSDGLGWTEGDLFDCLVVHAVALLDGDMTIADVMGRVFWTVLEQVPLAPEQRTMIKTAVGDVFREICVRSSSFV